jgi:chromosome segregation ATPase
MAETKLEQLARQTELELAIVRKDVESLQHDIDSANLNQIRERLAVLEDRINELKKSKEESEKRYWQFVVLFVGGLVTLGINLVVSFIRK